MISIALTVGYNSPSHFAAIFRKHTGISPSQYRHENMRSKTPTV
jgi:AraC family transcriptional regulator